MIRVLLKWLKRSLLSVTALVVLVALIIAGLLFTHTGLKIAVWGAQKALPQLKIEQAEGAIIPQLSLLNTQFKDESLSVDVKLEKLTLGINPECFLSPAVCIDQLKLSGLDFTLSKLPESESSEEKPSEPLTEIRLPIPVQVNNIELNNIALDILGNKVNWQHFSTQIGMSDRTLTLYPTKFDGVTVELAASEAEGQVAKEKTEQESHTPEKESAKPIELPEVLIPLEVNLNRFELTRFTLKGDTPVEVNRLLLVAHADKHDVDIQTLELDVPQANLEMVTQISLRDDYPLQLHAQADVKQTDLKGQKLALTVNKSVADMELEATLSERIATHLEGSLKPLHPDLPFDLAVTEGHMQWPFSGKADYIIDIDALHTSGSLKGYQLALDAKANGESIPAVELNVAGEGNLSQIDLETIQLNTLGGEVSGQVMANWDAPVNWQATLGLKDIQPGLQWEAAEGNISGSLSTSGQLLGTGGWQVLLPALDIEGIVRNYPLDIEGNLIAQDREGKGDIEIETEGLKVMHGSNNIFISGDLHKEWNIDTRIDIPQLAKSVPDVQGKVNGTLNLRGPLLTPELDFNLNSSGIGYQDQVKVASVNLNGELSPLPAPQGQLSVYVGKLEAQGQVIDSIDLSFAGKREEHGLSLTLLSEMVKASVHISGGLEQKPQMVWKGRLDKADLSTKQGPWSLDHTVGLEFQIEQQIAKIQAHCWSQASSSVCLTKDVTAGKSGSAEVAIENFDFSQIAMFIPEEFALEGEVNANARANWKPGEQPDIAARIVLPKGQVTQNTEQNLSLGWEEIQLNAKLHDDRLQADWLLQLTDNGQISGDAEIPNVLVKQKSLNANLSIDTITLGMLQPLLGEYSKLDARLDSELHVSGPIMHPEVKGEFTVNNILLQGDVTPIEVKKGRVLVKLNGYDAILDADIETTDGILTLDGDAGWKDMQAWHTNIDIHSNGLNVDVPPMVKVKVKPEMTISVTPKVARVDGDIYLPWGRVTVEELPKSAISVSSDEVIVNKDLTPVEEPSSLPMVLQTNVKIHIGDDFKLSAFGLNSELIGQMIVTQKDKGPYVVGEISLEDGTYRSFGQDLVIEKGKILMNGPVDLPYLQITAIRNPDNTRDDVVAGIKVTGPANEPVIDVFSDPVMPQQNALSYLLRGQDIDGESGGDTMTTALIGLSLAKSGRVVGQIGEAFGVSDLQLDTEGSGDESQVTVSGYILPGLQVKYGVGIFDSFGEFTVRYRLMQDLYLEAVSGVDSAVDLLYQFEFD